MQNTLEGNTDRRLNDSSEVLNHISSCADFNHIQTLWNSTPKDNNITCNLSDFLFNNCEIINRSDHWSLLLFKNHLQY